MRTDEPTRRRVDLVECAADGASRWRPRASTVKLSGADDRGGAASLEWQGSLAPTSAEAVRELDPIIR